MRQDRSVADIFKARPTLEGAGVRLRRAFGFHQAPRLDPFLLLDDIHSTQPADYLAGFPWHPHRGIETVTYVMRGRVDHGDSLGNKGVIGSGDVQWMTAGSGIIHQEMPRKWDGDMRGLQLWVNLPASGKMMEPRYRDIESGTVPELDLEEGVHVKVIAGTFGEHSGPVQDIVRRPDYLDVTLDPGKGFAHEVHHERLAFAYLLDGSGFFGSGDTVEAGSETTLLFGEGKNVVVRSGEEGVRFLLVSGEPIREPVAWGGPIVMNTEEELELAFREYREGTFLKHQRTGT